MAMALVSYVCLLRVAEAASVHAGDVRDSCYVVFWNSKPGMKHGGGDLCRSGCGVVWSGFSNGPRTDGWPGMICCSLQGQLNWKDRWRTWCAERLGLATGGTAFAEAVQRLAGKGVRNYHISSGGAGGQPRPQQWRMPWGIGIRMLSPHFACRRFGVRSRDPCSWSPKKCGATSCMRVNDATRTSRFGDVEKEGEQRLVCSRERGMPASRGLTRRIWAAHRTIPTLGFRWTKVLCNAQVCDNLQASLQRRRERGAPGEAAVRGPGVWVTAPSRVPVQTPGVQDSKRNSQVQGHATRRQEVKESSSSRRHLRPNQGPEKSGIHGAPRTLFKESQQPGRDRWLAEAYQCHQGGRVARRWRWRKILDGEPVADGWRDLSGETGRAMATRDPNASDPGLYPVAPSSDSGVRAVLGDEGAGSDMKVSGVVEGVVGLGPRLHYKGGVFVTTMAELTRHFVWLTLKLACAEALLVHRLWIFLLRLTSVCEDFRLDEPMAVCLMAVRCLSPEAWDSLNHLSTSPKPKLARVTPAILAAGIGEVGCYQMTEREWDEIVPPRFLRFMEFFDLREMPKGNGRVRKPVLGVTNAIRRTGVLHDEDPSMTPTCFPFVIPKNSVKCSLLLSCVRIHEGLPLKPQSSLWRRGS